VICCRSGRLSLGLLVGLLAGCNMCQNPYDYCGAVVQPDGCMNCAFNTRQGSVFAPPPGSPDIDATAETPTPTAAPADLGNLGEELQGDSPVAETAQLESPEADETLTR
jgi:hypothetical protein